MQFIVAILVGLVVGLIARLLLPGRDPIGIIGTILVGVVAALIGTFLWEAIFGPEQEDTAWIGSIILAMVILWIYRRVVGGRQEPI